VIRAASALVREIPDGRAAAAAALRQAAARLEAPPSGAIVFATPQYRTDAEAILGVFRDAGCASVVGGCASGVLSDEGEAESGRAVAVLLVAGVDLRSFHSDAVSDMRGLLPPGDVRVILPDPARVDLADLMKVHDGGGEFQSLVGGALSGGSEKSGHFQFAGDRVAEGGITGFTLSGVSHVLGIAHGCRPIGRPLVVTRCHGHIVMSLAGRAPMELLREALEAHQKGEGGSGGPVLAGLAMDSAKSPLGRGDFVVRNLLAVQSEQGAVLAVGTPVRVGQTLVFHLMDRASATEDMREMVAGVKQELKSAPAFALYFNCRGRGKNLFGETDHDVLEIRTALGNLPMIGFFGNAEFAPAAGHNWMHTYTGVLLVVGQGVSSAGRK